MKVLFSGSLNVLTGGPAMSTSLAMLGLRDLGIDARIFMNLREINCKLRSDKIPIIWSKKSFDDRTGFPWKLFSNDIFFQEADIIHSQGVWDYSVYALTNYAKKNNKPYLISLRGMLYPQALKKSTLKKKVMMYLLTSKILKEASCIHATCDEEMFFYRNLGFKNPVAVIPNPINISPEQICYKKNFETSVFRVGYLGRLHKRKNIESLIYALSVLNKKYNNIELIIIGGGDNDYEIKLKELAQYLKVNNISFKGFISGKEKDKVLNTLSLLVMPSEFENFGNVILEALVRQIPCIATKGAPWKVLEDYNCGWWVDYDQNKITESIESALTLSKTNISVMGNNGLRLVQECFSKEVVGRNFSEVYNWILNGGIKPDFVYE